MRISRKELIRSGSRCRTKRCRFFLHAPGRGLVSCHRKLDPALHAYEQTPGTVYLYKIDTYDPIQLEPEMIP
jgi:hypothetical protein